ncbi:MAG: hypothetical protein JWO82_269, partial [Akkermansiaceae bacterium]|nr:hypothetical protein [Akkermansiaceae bacterium]
MGTEAAREELVKLAGVAARTLLQ